MTAPRILVVEDERIIALDLRQQLTSLGYDVPNTVSTGDHALRRVEEAQPDLVLMDINLKGRMDGIATAAAIRRSYPIPIIFLTAYSKDETLAQAMATNPHGYLLKPFSGRELHAMIQVTLSRCRTERASQAAQQRLQQARKMEALTQLAGGIADEVDDLLTMLYGQLEVLGGHVIGEPALTEPIQDAFGEAIEKERLIRRLLEFCGRRKLTPVMVSLNDLMPRVSGRLRQLMGETIPIRVLLPDDLWPAWIDPDQLARALANLATNAREAMPDGGSLTIEAQNTDIEYAGADRGSGSERFVTLSVSDTGIGMPAGVVERAFEPFFTTRPSNGGTGLGLSLVFGFIRQSGGHVSIDSKPGSGTTVRLYLPTAMSDDHTVPSADDQTWLTLRADNHAAEPAGNHVLNSVAVAPDPFGNVHIRSRVTATSGLHTELPISWHRAGNAVFASVVGPVGQVQYRLIVEPLPRQDGWDWTVWRSGTPERQSRYGRASSVVSAMAAAEDAAGNWELSGLPGDGSDASDHVG